MMRSARLKTTRMSCSISTIVKRSSRCSRRMSAVASCVSWSPIPAVGSSSSSRRIFANLTVAENLRVPAARSGPWNEDRVYQLFPRLHERRGNRGRQLSGGEQEMLAIARALILNPRLLILDEPSQGLAPLIVREMFDVVVRMRSEGISVLLVEQNARMSLEIADNAYVLDDGAVVYAGSAAELRADEARVQELAGASAEASWSDVAPA